ncbi:MAG: DsbA family oxidoreductase [Acidobacteriota bacterium]|nr:DsbA family oxidoreductase [Acidobacteriota bacterium]
MKTPLHIDIVSDVVCPWCIIGFKRLEKALAGFADRADVSLRWHAFELNPHMPEGGENLRAHLAAKYGTTLEGSIAARKRLTAMGEELGFPFDYFDEMRMFNTFKAHQLLLWAHGEGKQTELKLRLFSAFFGERKAIDETEVLVKEAVEVGLDEGRARHILAENTYADAVREEERRWQQLGLHAVPAFIINSKYVIQGAQDTSVLATRIEKLVNA